MLAFDWQLQIVGNSNHINSFFHSLVLPFDGIVTCLFYRIQVLANSGIATALVVIVGNLTGWQDKCLDSKDSALVTCLIGGVIGQYACCNGDTWSSELGMLSDAQPRLITTFKVCLFHEFE